MLEKTPLNFALSALIPRESPKLPRFFYTHRVTFESIWNPFVQFGPLLDNKYFDARFAIAEALGCSHYARYGHQFTSMVSEYLFDRLWYHRILPSMVDNALVCARDNIHQNKEQTDGDVSHFWKHQRGSPLRSYALGCPS
jgi:hypothetical protein